ncbi:MAG: ABC transporter ATP-binding protein [Acidobacteria bacterium]|nr:ABC transporter ATP-binding protein [Acidobacteriota bacterium]
MKALEIINLKKTFKSNFLLKKYHVLKDINLSVEKGEIYGFLGPNGAGKTTTIKCTLGITFPDSGQISIMGQPANKTESKKKIGFLPEHPYFYDYLTPVELLTFTGMLFGIHGRPLAERIPGLICLVGLEGKENIKLKKFSKGMLQRVGLAQTLVHDPDLLILDEPFSGLDPIGRKELRDIILSLKEKGKTIFFSSHILQDMELMVDRVGIILGGKTRREGKLSDLISLSVNNYEIVFTGLPENVLKENHLAFNLRDNDYITWADTNEESNRIIGIINRAGGNIISVTPMKMTLEDIFLKEIKE